jgi:hypothetical protein
MSSHQRRVFRVKRSGDPGSSRAREHESQDGGLEAQPPSAESPTLPARNLSAALGEVASQAAGLTSASASLNGAAHSGATTSRQDYSPERHAPRRGGPSLAESGGEPLETQAASDCDLQVTTPRRKALVNMVKAANVAVLEAREETARLRKVRAWRLPSCLVRLSILTSSLLRRGEGSRVVVPIHGACVTILLTTAFASLYVTVLNPLSPPTRALCLRTYG